jgi:hypothetical protein
MARRGVARGAVLLAALVLAPAARADVLTAAGDSPQSDLPPS